MKKGLKLLCIAVLAMTMVLGMVMSASAGGAEGDVDTSTLRVLTDTDGSGVVGAPWKMSANGAKVLTPCIDTLVKMDTDCTIYPCLAESWELADDKSSITFKLREDVTFTDGTPFDADAVVWNLNQWKDGGQVGMCYSWANVEAVDEYTVKIDLMYYQNTVLTGFTEAFLGFISPAAAEENGLEWCESNIVSTGPFVLDSLEPGVGWSYVKNENYWGEEPKLDRIEFTYVGDKNTMKLKMLNGEADLITWDSSGDAEIKNELVANGFELIGYENGSEPTCLYFDSKDPESPFAIKEVREAVDYALDKEALAAIGEGLWVATYQMVGPDSQLYDETLVREYDPEKAKALLAEAGFPDGFSTQMIVEETADHSMFTAMVAMLEMVGIKCDLQITPTAQMFGMAMGGWSGMMELPCPVAPNYSDSAYSFLGKNGPVAVSLNTTDEMEALLQQASGCELGEEQHAVVKEFIKEVFEDVDVVPVIVAIGTVGIKAPYVHDDGWGSLTQGYWTPGLCYIEK